MSCSEGKQKRDDLVDPYWIEDRDLKRGEVDFISTTEMQFWRDLLAKYLYPIDDDKNERVSVAGVCLLRTMQLLRFLNHIFILILIFEKFAALQPAMPC